MALNMYVESLVLALLDDDGDDGDDDGDDDDDDDDSPSPLFLLPQFLPCFLLFCLSFFLLHRRTELWTLHLLT